MYGFFFSLSISIHIKWILLCMRPLPIRIAVQCAFETAEEQCIYGVLFSCLSIQIGAGWKCCSQFAPDFHLIIENSPSSFAPSSLSPRLLLMLFNFTILHESSATYAAWFHSNWAVYSTVGNPEKIYPHACATYLFHLLFS